MTSIPARLIGGTVNAVLTTPFSAAFGALSGYVYAKLADLPANEVAKAWAIWSAARSALITFSTALVEGGTAKAFLTTVITGISTAVGINELQKRELIGHKMVVFLIVVQVFSTLGFLSDLVLPEEDATA
jgi:hypothetical protein